MVFSTLIPQLQIVEGASSSQMHSGHRVGGGEASAERTSVVVMFDQREWLTFRWGMVSFQVRVLIQSPTRVLKFSSISFPKFPPTRTSPSPIECRDLISDTDAEQGIKNKVYMSRLGTYNKIQRTSIRIPTRAHEVNPLQPEGSSSWRFASFLDPTFFAPVKDWIKIGINLCIELGG